MQPMPLEPMFLLTLVGCAGFVLGIRSWIVLE